VGCVYKNKKNILVTMKGKKKSSSLIEIKSMLQELRNELLEKGHALRELLEAVYLDVDAVHSAVGEILFQLEDHPVDISDRWVSTHVVVDSNRKSISNRLVRRVSILFISVSTVHEMQLHN
jgi:hypothetical protein